MINLPITLLIFYSSSLPVKLDDFTFEPSKIHVLHIIFIIFLLQQLHIPLKLSTLLAVQFFLHLAQGLLLCLLCQFSLEFL